MIFMIYVGRGGPVVARLTCNHEVVSSNPGRHVPAMLVLKLHPGNKGFDHI